MTGRDQALELKAFSTRLSRTDRCAAEELWEVFAETKAVLASVHATWALALAGGGHNDLRVVQDRSRERVLALIDRAANIRLHHDSGRAYFVASLRDFARALAVDEDGPLLASAVAYESGRQLAQRLWAFEFAPEGAPLSESAASTFRA